MAEFWQKWKKPWTTEQCRDAYVQTEWGFRELGDRSGRNKATLLKWSNSDPLGTWGEQRDQYNLRRRTETDRKTVEKISDQLSDQWSGLAIEHFQVHKLFRELAEIQGRLFKKQAEKLEQQMTHPEMDEELLREMQTLLNPISINAWSLILDRAIKGERIAVSMDYHDRNIALAEVEKMGLVVTDPNGSSVTEQGAVESPQKN